MGSHSYLQNLCSGSACDQMRHMQELRSHNKYTNFMQELPSHNKYVKFLQNLDTPTQWWLIPNAQGVLEIVNVDMTTEEGQEKQAILIPDVPESSGARPWTQESWNQWNLLEHNGTAHPDRPFSKQYGFEPFLMIWVESWAFQIELKYLHRYNLTKLHL